MGQQAVAMTGDIFGSVLEPSRTNPATNRLCTFKLSHHIGKLPHVGPEFLLRVHPGFGMNVSVKHQPDAAERIGALLMIVEGNDPKPAALKDMMQRALRKRILKAMLLLRRSDLVIQSYSYHMGEDRPRISAEVVRVVTKLEPMRQHGLHAGAVNQVLASECLTFLAGESNVIFLNVEFRDPGLLADVRPVVQSHCHHVSVCILTEEMAVRPHGRSERRILMCLSRNLLLAFSLVEKTKGPLYTACRADVVASGMKRAQV